jgi:hypothetical protein
MKKSKFDLLFENIIETLSDAEVSYTPVNQLVLSIIAKKIGMPVEEIIENDWSIETYVADESDIISFVNDGFNNDVTRKEAADLAGKLLIIDLEGLPLDADTYDELIEDKELYEEILNAVKANGERKIIELCIK